MNHTRRWKSSLHEAAHLQAVKVLRKDKTGAAVVLNNGGGLLLTAESSDKTPKSFVDILIAAVGPDAERLADHYESPTEKPNPSPIVTPGPAKESCYEELATVSRELITDESFIARWCVEAQPTNPDEWERRYRWIHREAERFIQENEHEIVDIARKLFCGGIVFLRKESL